MSLVVKTFFEKATSTGVYVAHDPETKKAAVIDSVMDYDPAAGRTDHSHCDQVVEYVKENGLDVQWILETHVHADHLTGAKYLKTQLGGTTAIGENVTKVQSTFAPVFNLKEFACDGSQFDKLLKDGDELNVGQIKGRVMYTPGHTPACCSYVIGDAVFVGDTIFQPDFGTARCDFPGGSVDDLYSSIQKLYTLPDETRVFVGHDYAPGGREHKFETTIGDEKRDNKQVKVGMTREQFTEFRTARDAKLGAPRLLLPSLQTNLRNGDLPPAEDNGTSYFKIPINTI